MKTTTSTGQNKVNKINKNSVDNVLNPDYSCVMKIKVVKTSSQGNRNMMKLLARGNGKLHSSILCWSITPVKSCRNCAQCKQDCYALQPYRQYPCTKIAWDRNYEMAQDGSFVAHVKDQLARSRTVKAVRIHVAGDFFSADYIKNWIEVASSFKNIKFYSYSKVFGIFGNELSELTSLENVNIINSITSDGGVNFGGVGRIDALVNIGYKACPVTKKNKIICGKDCNICLTYDKVCFHIH